jgi:hypothetical protein
MFLVFLGCTQRTEYVSVFLALGLQDTNISNKPYFSGTKFQAVDRKYGGDLTKLTVAPYPNESLLDT